MLRTLTTSAVPGELCLVWSGRLFLRGYSCAALLVARCYRPSVVVGAALLVFASRARRSTYGSHCPDPLVVPTLSAAAAACGHRQGMLPCLAVFIAFRCPALLMAVRHLLGPSRFPFTADCVRSSAPLYRFVSALAPALILPAVGTRFLCIPSPLLGVAPLATLCSFVIH